MNPKRVIPTTVILLFIFIVTAPELFAGEIIVPWRAKKEIVKQGLEFPVWFNKGITEEIISVTLKGPYNTVPLSIINNESGLWYYDEYTRASFNCNLSVKVPEGTPAELYDLVILTSAGTFTSRSAVKVIKEYLNHYYICHFADPHVSVSWTDKGNATAPIMQALGEIITLIDPEMAICTGDNIIGFSRTEEIPEKFSDRWDAFWDGITPDGLGGMHNTRVPVYITSGNNDYDKYRDQPDEEKMYKLKDWNKYCGMRVFGFAYDQTRFLAFDDYLGEIGDHARYNGVSKDFPVIQSKILEKYLSDSGAGKLRIVLQHAPNRVDTAFCDNNNIQLALCGHTHRDRVRELGITPTTVCETAYVCFAEYWSPGFKMADSAKTKLRIIEVKNNEIVSNESIYIMDYIQVMKGNSDGKFLTLSYNKANNGKESSLTATIKNRINYSFKGCRVRFVMPRGEYTIDKGTVLQSFDNDDISVYDIRVPVEASGSVSVTIKPESIN